MPTVGKPGVASAALVATLLASAGAFATTLSVGPRETYTTPCAAIAAAAAGDTIAVDAAGSYDGDTCAWSTDGLTITGVNGRTRIDLTGVTPADDKGIFTIEGTASATIENFELSGAAFSAADGNNGLAAPATPNTGAVLVENSEFCNSAPREPTSTGRRLSRGHMVYGQLAVERSSL
jgi:hypothetical protein